MENFILYNIYIVVMVRNYNLPESDEIQSQSKKVGALAIIAIIVAVIAVIGVSSYFAWICTTSISSSASAENMCIKSGVLTQNENWSGIIYIDGKVCVPKGITLTIEPGTIVKFKYSRDYKHPEKGGLAVNGIIRALGTPEKPIWFTSAAEKPIHGDWGGIFIDNGEGELDHVIIEYAYLGIVFWTSSGKVTNSIIRWITTEGIYMERSDPVLENNTIYGAGYNGIAMEQFNYNVIIRNNKIINNQGHGIHGEATNAIIEYNIIRNNKYGVTFDDYSNVLIKHNLIENNSKEGLHFYVECNATLISNVIRNNGVGISSFKSWLKIHNNDIYGNVDPKERIMLNLVINDMHYVDAQQNWWGTTNSSDIKKTIRSDKEVLFEPFLIESAIDIREPVFDYKDVRKTELSYTPGDPEDEYPYIYAWEDETRRVVKRISAGMFGWSLCYDGSFLWKFSHAGGGDLIKINPETGEIAASFPNPGIAQDHGIAFDGKSLWINDFTTLKVFEVDPKTGKIVSSFNIPEMRGGASSITWDGQYLYLLSWLEQNKLYKIDRQGNLIDIIRLEAAGQTITFDGEYFWIAGSGNKIFKLNKEGKLIGWIYAVAEGTWAIAHDGKYLWTLQRTCETWDDPKIYKIQILSLKQK
jgi:glutamine cyclotransferase